jgi:hypothetical protein
MGEPTPVTVSDVESPTRYPLQKSFVYAPEGGGATLRAQYGQDATCAATLRTTTATAPGRPRNKVAERLARGSGS